MSEPAVPAAPVETAPDDGGASLSVWAPPGFPEVRPGDDLAELVGRAVSTGPTSRALRDGDVVVVTSKIVSKAEGRVVHAADREQAISDETVRVVATRPRPDGQPPLRIVENRPDVPVEK